MKSTKILVTMGRGGTGKTTFVALFADYLIHKGETPLLLVDLDPDQSLGEMIGVDLATEGRKTIAELIEETFIGQGGSMVGIPPSERIEHKIWQHGLYEGTNFDFLSIGTKWALGCYCMPDAALRDALSRLTKQYRYVLIDAPGGLEHLNRRVTSDVDDIFDILDPSSKSFAHLNRARRVVDEAGITYKKFFCIGGFRFIDSLSERAGSIDGIEYLGDIAEDQEITSRTISGKSLFGISPDAPGPASIRCILEHAGY